MKRSWFQSSKFTSSQFVRKLLYPSIPVKLNLWKWYDSITVRFSTCTGWILWVTFVSFISSNLSFKLLSITLQTYNLQFNLFLKNSKVSKFLYTFNFYNFNLIRSRHPLYRSTIERVVTGLDVEFSATRFSETEMTFDLCQHRAHW